MNQRHVLLLDPDDDQRRNLAFLLRLAGYRVTEVADGDETLNRLTLCSENLPVDLLLICPGATALNLGDFLQRLQPWQPPHLIVSEELGVIRQSSDSTSPPKTCRRNEIIETLGAFWAANPPQPSPLTMAAHPRQEQSK